MNRSADYFYGFVFLVLAATCLLYVIQSSWTLLLLWPTVSFGIVALAYLTGDVRWFGKRADGTRQWMATLLLLPYLLLAHGVWRLQTSLSREPAFQALGDNLILARRLRDHELPPHIDRICDLTCEFRDPPAVRSCRGYVSYPILDAGTSNAEDLTRLARQLPPEDASPLLIHCANGHGRTGMFAAVWLLTHGMAPTAEDAIRMVQESRPGVKLRPRQRDIVREAAAALGN